jgi:dihydrofolate reductase
LDFGLRQLAPDVAGSGGCSQSKIQNPKSKITMIVAMSRNRVIGRRGELPWHLPADLARFKRRTMGLPVIMGRKTWAAIPERFRPLPGRTNIIITREPGYAAEGAIVTHSLDEALAAARTAAPVATEVFIAGGAEVYRRALPVADRIDVTLVEATIADGDAFFPEFESDSSWRMVCEERHAADTKHASGYVFRQYERDRTSDVR